MQEYSQYITFMHIFPDFALKHSMKVIYEISKFEQTYQQPEIGKSSNGFNTFPLNFN